MKQALLVIDVQNDLCAKNGYLNKIGYNLSKIDKTVTRIRAVINKAREKSIEVIFVKSIADKKYCHPNIWKRLKKNKRAGYLKENSER